MYKLTTASHPSRGIPLVLAFALIFAVLLALHAPLLRLPYFWDEAGYYVPAARDLLLNGSVIPHSTPSNAHPPLVIAYLALCWKIAGFTPLVTRVAMLMAASFSLLGLFRLAETVANREVAAGTVLCTALYPVFFAQSSLAHLDLVAAGLTFWGLDSYVKRRTWQTASVVFTRGAEQRDRNPGAAGAFRLGNSLALAWYRKPGELAKVRPAKSRARTAHGFCFRFFLSLPGTATTI